jgi:hypothetical protein
MGAANGQRSSNIIGRYRRWALLLALVLASCGPGDPDRVVAEGHDALWLWAGVRPPAELDKAKTVYVLDGEIRGAPARFVPLRPSAPRTHGPDIWLVIRTDTLDWPPASAEALADRLDHWTRAGNRVAGLQIDFDARTRHLDEYAGFLKDLRQHLPSRYRLSITGLLDWSAHGDPRALEALRGTVDEVVLQTYQGRATIPGYEAYFDRLEDFDIPFRVGLVEGGRWIEPPSLARNPRFKGYVVFLLQPRGRGR